MNKNLSSCFDNNLKEYKITFDSGFLPDDTWLICKYCYNKPEFSYYKTSEIKINSEQES